MENLDSRKRPLDGLDGESDCGVTKKSNQGGKDNVHLKILVPSIAAGAIIGKGGETISQIQKEIGASVKMSKAQDFYPGTSERVCLIIGSLEAVRKVHAFISERIQERPDANPKPVDGEAKVNFERHKQVKILIPNSTAGMVIGKNGNHIREIKDDSGAYVQISQKSKEMNLPERCITIAGDTEQNLNAVDLILQKIVDDPQSSSCPNISYSDYKGPVASSNPTGSPFAAGPLGQQPRMDIGGGGGVGGGGVMNPNVFNNIGNSMNNLNLNAGCHQRGGPGATAGPASGPTGPVAVPSVAGNPAVETMRATLRGSGYTELAIDEIISAVITLANYGLFGFGVNLSGLGLQQQQQGGGGGAGGVNMHGGPMAGVGQNQGGRVTLSNLANIMNGQGGGGNNPMAASGNNMGGGNMIGINNLGGGGGGGLTNGNRGDGNPPVFGPVGSTTTTKAGGDTGEGGGSFYANAGPGSGTSRIGQESVFSGGGGGGGGSIAGGGMGGGGGGMNQGFMGPNQNSFGLGTGMGGLSMPAGAQGGGGEEPTTKDIEVGEYIIGAILGPGGRGIVEIQNYTGANIQISKKGVFAPGTRNRVVTISGAPSTIQNAEFIIRQRISHEEANRNRQGMRQ